MPDEASRQRYEELLHEGTHTEVVIAQPAWYQKLLLAVTVLYLVSGPIAAYWIYQSWPDKKTIEYNRYIFCLQEQVNSRILSNECLVILHNQQEK